jgi:hypothetical protein
MKKVFFATVVLLFFSTILNAAYYDYLFPDVLNKDYKNIDSVAYGIWYRTNEPHNNALQKPFLLVSGFDPSDVVRVGEEVSGETDKVYLYQLANKDGFLDQLRQRGYDIVAFRCKQSMASIVANGSLLMQFMKEEIIEKKIGDSKLVVAGASMGGLLVRYALTKMEHDGDKQLHYDKAQEIEQTTNNTKNTYICHHLLFLPKKLRNFAV